MNDLTEYTVEVESDRDMNEIIKWWNDVLFEQGYVRVDEFEYICNIASEFCHTKLCWTFELTTNHIEVYTRKDTYHVKSGWRIFLPKPVALPKEKKND